MQNKDGVRNKLAVYLKDPVYIWHILTGVKLNKQLNPVLQEHTIWLKGYQNGNHKKPSEQRLQEISIAKN